MLRCQDIVDLLDQYLDEALDRADVETLEGHLADCRDCTAFVNTYRGTVSTSRNLRESELPAELRERLLTFLRARTPR